MPFSGGLDELTGIFLFMSALKPAVVLAFEAIVLLTVVPVLGLPVIALLDK